MDDKPELRVRYTAGEGYNILLVGRDRYIGVDVTDEELDNSDELLEPVLFAIKYLRSRWSQ